MEENRKIIFSNWFITFFLLFHLALIFDTKFVKLFEVNLHSILVFSAPFVALFFLTTLLFLFFKTYKYSRIIFLNLILLALVIAHYLLYIDSAKDGGIF